jgi:hypothetical protein
LIIYGKKYRDRDRNKKYRDRNKKYRDRDRNKKFGVHIITK